MKKVTILILVLLSCSLQMLFSQYYRTYNENFDGATISWTPSPTNSWDINSNYFLSYPNAYHGLVPNNLQDSVVFESPIYNFRLSGHRVYVQLRFDHICRIAPTDILRLEYRQNLVGSTWKVVEEEDYIGSASNYAAIKGFNSSSYPEWNTNNLSVPPSMNSWKREVFELITSFVAQENVQFRFVLKHGNTLGTHVSYGWLIDNFEVIMDTVPILFPTVEFVAPLVQDTFYLPGPYEITARVKSNSSAPLRRNPYLKYRINNTSGIFTDSILMDFQGNNLWTAFIPSMPANTQVIYSISEEDTLGNYNFAQSGYFVMQDPSKGYGDNSVSMVSFDDPKQFGLMAGEVADVKISFRNEGSSDLDSVIINWAVNSVLMPPFIWRGNLSWTEQMDSITIGSYIPSPNTFDTICVWLSSPNNLVDNVLNDDTLVNILYGCAERLAGEYTVGTSGDYATLGDIFYILRYCGASDDLVVKIQNDTLRESVDLSEMRMSMGHNSLYITSLSGNKNDVVIQSDSGENAFILGNIDNVTIDAITIDATKGLSAVKFVSGGNNISIKNCKIIAESGAQLVEHSAIYKASGTGMLNNFQIINNEIDGGYAGIYLYSGVSGLHGRNITIDNNIITNPFYYGMYCYYTDSKSISNNRITSGVSAGSNWTGMHLYQLRKGGNVLGNHIKSNNANITTTLIGLYINYISDATVANNEIYLNSEATTTRGIYLDYPNSTKFLHNTVLLTGEGGTTFQAFYWYTYGNTTYDAIVKNNIFVANGGTEPYALYLTANIGSYQNNYQLNYNNYYSSDDLGYVGGAQTDMTAWQSVVTADTNSKNILPDFMDSTINLKLENYIGLECPLISPANNDITNMIRGGQTTMGCYAAPILNVDAALVKVLNLGKNPVIGEQDTLSIVITNAGITPLISATIDWTINEVNRMPVSLSKSLAYGESDTIFLGEITYVQKNEINVFISSLGSLTDQYYNNDTLSSYTLACNTMLNGVLTIGTGGDYATISEVIELLYACGINGPTTLSLLDGTYQESITLDGTIVGLNDINTLTITSFSGNKENVIIQPIGKNGFTIGNINNIHIRNITIDARTKGGRYGIEFVNSCDNIIIDNNTILVNLTGTTLAEGYSPIGQAQTAGVVNNLHILNNELDGGYSGLSLFTGISSSLYGKGIVIHNNTITNFHYYGINCAYTDFDSISYNTILTKESGGSSTWYGLRVYYSNGKVIGNKIRQRNTASSSYGLYTSYYNHYLTTDWGLIANNEINISSTGTYYGLYATAYTKANILHNSVYVKGTGATRAMAIANSAYTFLTVKNNYFMTESSGSYPIYLAGITYINQWDIDYNNYVSPTNIGYASSAQSNMNIWRAVVTTDLHSTRITPEFADVNTSLKYLNVAGIDCPKQISVPFDIDGRVRPNITTMGAYHYKQEPIDIAIQEVIRIDGSAYIGIDDTVSIVVYNAGTDTIKSFDLSWKLDGNALQGSNWTGVLAPSESVTVLLGTYAPIVAGNNILTIWTSNPNQSADGNVLNDTINETVYVCAGALAAGDYTVGPGGDYPNMTELINLLNRCGVAGSVTLSFLPNTFSYGALSLGNIQGVSPENTITITSSTGKTSDVIFSSMTFTNAHDILVKDVTVSVSATAAVTFAGDAKNITVAHCSISLDTTTTTTTARGFFKSSTNNVFDNIRIIGNTVNGGYSGLEFYEGSTGLYGNNIYVDSNVFTNQYYYVTRFRYVNVNSISNNIMVGRTDISTSYWYGIYLGNVNVEKINANRIWQRAAATYPYGIYMTTVNFGLSYPVSITNNEIYTRGAASNYYHGIYALTSTNIKVMFNSVYNDGKDAACISLANFTNIEATIKYNNFFAADSCYPINFVSTAYQTAGWDVGYNNYYSMPFIGAANGVNHTTMASWVAAVSYDSTSVSLQPNYLNFTQSLELADYIGLEVMADKDVLYDINGNYRSGRTSIGAYAMPPVSENAMLINILGWNETARPGANDTVKVILTNGGTTPLTHANIAWQFNAISQSPVSWGGTLAMGQSDTITLGEITYISGRNNLRAWISDLGTSGIIDIYPHDDTVSVSSFICDSLLNGTYTVGVSGNFKTITDAVETIYTCGINGAITFELQDSLYIESVELKDAIPGSSDVNVVTFTTAPSRSTMAKIYGAGTPAEDDAAFTLNSVSNLLFTNLHIYGSSTISGTYSYSKAIKILNTCDNLEISNCRITNPFFSTAVTSNSYSGIVKSATAGVISNIRITDNIIEGGSHGIYLTGTTGNRNSYIQIKNNTIQVDRYGMYVYYTDSLIIENNIITQRPHSSPSELYGIYAGYNYGSITKNRIKADALYHGIYTTYFNNTVSHRGLIANNEVIGNVTSTTANKAGISAYTQTNANIYHNSVLIGGTGLGYGLNIYVSGSTTNPNTNVDVQNNIFTVTTSGTTYPVFTAYPNFITQFNINNNNYYNSLGANIGYAGAAKATMSDWTATVTTDVNSVNIEPVFADAAVSLALEVGTGLECSLISSVLRDIKDTIRKSPTTLGAYQFIPYRFDIAPVSIISPTSSTSVGTVVPVEITIQNFGTDTITNLTINWNVNGVDSLPYTWTGSLAMGEISNAITIGNLIPIAREHEIVIWTSTPNGSEDQKHKNDTIQMIVYGCDSTMRGVYSIGVAANNHFTKITDFVKAIYACGIDAPVTAELQDSNYIEIVELTGQIPGSSMQNIVTFTSALQDAAKTTVQRSDNATLDVAPFILTDVANIVISKLSLSGSSPYSNTYSYAKSIILRDGCDNIEISNCILRIPSFGTSTATSESYTVIHKPTGVGTVSNIRILDNIIEGGAYGIYMRGGATGNRNKNILIQNNSISSVGKYGMYIYWTDSANIINNTIEQRIHKQIHDFYGIYYYYSSGNILSNRIKADSAIYGIYLFYASNIAGLNNTLVANNEIMIRTMRTGTISYTGINAYYSKADILHNSILIAEKGNAFYITGSATYPTVVKNNNFVTFGNDSYPFYSGSTTATVLAVWDIDYNNYYAPVNVGYAGAAKTNLTDWTAVMTQDVNSVRVQPIYANNAVSLELLDYNGLKCPVVLLVGNDILGTPRVAGTVMGAYELPVLNVNVRLSDMIGIPNFIFVGQSLNPRIVFANVGNTLTDSVTVSWTHNGNLQPSVIWKGSLNFGETDTLILPTFPVTQGQNKIAVWLSDVNGNGLDMRQSDDTLAVDFFACDSLMRGDYIIGNAAGADFATIEDVLEKMYICGVGGNIQLLYQGGRYTDNVDLSDFGSIMYPYYLTITSVPNDSVVFATTSSRSAAFKLSNTRNVIFDDITIDARTDTSYAIQFLTACTNIIVKNCHLYANYSATSAVGGAAIYKPTSTGFVDSIIIINNKIDGGYYSIYFYGGTTSTYGSNVTIDSNIITNSYYGGLRLYYTGTKSVSYNKVTPRSGSKNGTWYGMYLYYLRDGGNIIGNRIFAENKNITTSLYGIYLNYATNALVANNEIYLYSHASTTRGLNMNYPTNVKVVHNSIYTLKNGTSGTNYAYYNYVNNNAIYSSTIKSNIFVAKGGAVGTIAAFYLGGSQAYYDAHGSNFDIDNNNYYSSGSYIGYVAGSYRTDLTAWKSVVLSDLNSKDINPVFIVPTLNLKLANYDGLECQRLSEVQFDIENRARTSLTTKGAYSVTWLEGYDLELFNMVEPSIAGTLCVDDYVRVRYAIRNGGNVDHDFSEDTVKLHFQLTGMLSFDTVIEINSGMLPVFTMDTFDIIDHLPVYYAGEYNITAWIESATDTIHGNDTLRTIYRNTKIALPYNQLFDDGDIFGLVIDSLSMGGMWQVVPTGYDTIIQPDYGTGKLIFEGQIGSMSRLRTGQLELNRTSQPLFEFWYMHDNSNPTQRDQIDIKITCNGSFDPGNYTLLRNIQRYNPAYTSPTWERYEIDLSSYVDSSCVIIAFDATSFGAAQHIDRIAIASNQNIALDTILIPELSVCMLENQKMKIVISNETGQTVDFSATPASIFVEVKGSTTQIFNHTLQGTIDGLEKDTIEFDFDFNPNMYTIKAYISTSVADFNRQDDTVSRIVSVNPDFNIEIIPISSSTNPAFAETKINQDIVVTNTGNLDLPQIRLILSVTSRTTPAYSFVIDTTVQNLLVNGSISIGFDSAYIIPWSRYYDVTVHGYLLCDSLLLNKTVRETEYVKMTDISVVRIGKPLEDGLKDETGSEIEVSAVIKNRDELNQYYREVIVGVRLEDMEGNVLPGGFTELIDMLDYGEELSYTFSKPYTVPNNLSSYKLKVYVERINGDDYRQNDTITMIRNTNHVGIVESSTIFFTLEQNMPNPAKNNTRIIYRVPQEGEIMFKVYSVNGQLLYTKRENVSFGEHLIDLDISSYASGIYFYTMTYKGQRITKRMNVKR